MACLVLQQNDYIFPSVDSTMIYNTNKVYDIPLQISIKTDPIKRLNLSKYSDIKELYDEKFKTWLIKKDIYNLKDIFHENNLHAGICNITGEHFDYVSITIIHSDINIKKVTSYDIVIVYDKNGNKVYEPKFFKDSSDDVTKYITSFEKNSYVDNSSVSTYHNIYKRDKKNIASYPTESTHMAPLNYTIFKHIIKFTGDIPIVSFGNGYSIFGRSKHTSDHKTNNTYDKDNNVKKSIYTTHNTEIEFNNDGSTKIKKSNTVKNSKYALYGYKRAKTLKGSKCIVKLGIPQDARFTKSHSEDSKMRTDKCTVLAIGTICTNKDKFTYYTFNEKEAISCVHASGFKYIIGDNIKIDNFDPDLSVVCVPGIHFFLHQQDALHYANVYNILLSKSSQEMLYIDDKFIKEDSSEDSESISDNIDLNLDSIKITNEAMDKFTSPSINNSNIKDDFTVTYSYQLKRSYNFDETDIPIPDMIIDDLREQLRTYIDIVDKAHTKINFNIKVDFKGLPRSVEALDLAYKDD